MRNDTPTELPVHARCVPWSIVSAKNVIVIGQRRTAVRRNHVLYASDSACSYAFLHSVVCLSVVCHIRAICLNCSTDLDVIWQVHLCGPMTHYVRWGSLAPKKEIYFFFGGGVQLPAKTCICQFYAAVWRIEI